MAILFHGTTLWRAQQILGAGPNPDFIEPGGQTEVLVGPDPGTVLRVAFANTPDEQSLELVRLPSEGVVNQGGQTTHGAVPTASGIEGEQSVRGEASLGSG